jgi:Mor family transcriptional regulator
MADVFDIMNDEDLTPDLKMIKETCGEETVKKLLRNFGGLSFYIPKISRLDSLVAKYMKKNKGKDYKQIARELKVSLQYLKKVDNEKIN